MNGLPYYKAYPRDFIEGTIGMPFELKGAYRLVLDLIYMQGGKLPDDPRYISGLLGCTVRKWQSLRSELVRMDKIQANDGLLSNYRAVSELETLSKLQEKQRENRSTPNKINKMQSPRCDHTEPEPEPYKEEHLTVLVESAEIVASPSPPLPIEDAIYNWNLYAEEFKLPKLVKLTSMRRKKLRARLAEIGIEGWNQALSEIEKSDFLRGKNGRNWSVTFDWMLSENNLAKMAEGTYSNERQLLNGYGKQ